ncbi:MAG: phosphatidylserine decarboxylase family protein [Deltaproteobacteria bacterium]|mgnify:CR=1 FL=1|nr:MAG: phosphatidylserine decarboxylase family protein [Deltaproteobacteria bacterium]
MLRGLPLKEGLPMIVPLAVAGAFFLVWRWQGLGVLFLVLSALLWFFFRNPQRIPPEGEDDIVSPADGRIIEVREGVSMPSQRQKGWLISIFMSLWDVHVNRAPVDCVVRSVDHRRGRFLPAFKAQAPLENERCVLLAEGPKGVPIAVVQVAGILARRIICRVRPGQRLRRGEPFGAIVFGSRVDLYLPLGTEILVEVGQKVRAGESVIGCLPNGGEDEEGPR